jgi:hypothetical protein
MVNLPLVTPQPGAPPSRGRSKRATVAVTERNGLKGKEVLRKEPSQEPWG